MDLSIHICINLKGLQHFRGYLGCAVWGMKQVRGVGPDGMLERWPPARRAYGSERILEEMHSQALPDLEAFFAQIFIEGHRITAIKTSFAKIFFGMFNTGGF